MSANPAPRLPLLPWLASALALGGALGAVPLGPWLTGSCAILVTCLGVRALPWLGFLLGGLFLARSETHSGTRPPVPARVALEVQVQAPERPASHRTQRTQRTRVRPLDPAVTRRQWILQEPADHPARHRGERLWIQARTHVSQEGRQVTLLVEHEEQVLGQPARPGVWSGLRHQLDQHSRRLGQRLSQVLSSTALGLVDALLRGDTSHLEQDDRDRLRHCGVWHLLVISGLHVALLAHLLERVLHARLGQTSASIVTLLVLGLFVLWTGARPPVTRAALTFLAGHIGRQIHRPTISSPALALVFVSLVLWRPANLLSAGTQLSFVAVLGISASMPYWFSGSPRGTGTGFDPRRPLLRALMLSTAASLATLPWCAWHFGQVAPWSPVTTLVVGPCLLLLTASALALLVLSPILPCMAVSLSAGVNGLAEACSWLLKCVDQLPGTPWWTTAPSQAFLVASVGALLLLQARRPGHALLLLVGAGVASHLWRVPEGDHATLMDVGQGQCLWVHQDGRDWLVDAGAMTDAAEADSRRALARRGVTSLEAVFVSHLDADHCRFLLAWVQQGLVQSLCLSAAHRSNWTHEDPPSTVRDLRRAALEQGVPVRFLARGDRVGPFQVQWPPRGRRFLADNDGSLVLGLRVGPRTLLVPGDITSFALVELTSHLGSQDVLVLPHHGNPDPALGALLERTRPLLALASRSSPLDPAPRDALRRAACAWVVTASAGTIQLAPGHGEIQCEHSNCHPATESE